MSDFFAYMALDESENAANSRKVAAVACKRAQTQFSKFLNQAADHTEFEVRLALIEGDIHRVVADVQDELGYRDENLIHTVVARLTPDHIRQQRVASTKEAVRRPRMCPYHKSVTEISLAEGKPSSGYSAMAQHAWSPQHCESDKYKGDSCKFRPEFTTQSFWDDRTEKRREKIDQRQEFVDAPQAEVETEVVEPVEALESPAEEFEEAPVEEASELNDSLAEAPSAVGVGGELAMAAKVTGWRTSTDTTGLGGPSPKFKRERHAPEVPDTEDSDSPNKSEHQDIAKPREVEDELGKKPDVGNAKSESGDKDTGPKPKKDNDWSDKVKQAEPVTKSAYGEMPSAPAPLAPAGLAQPSQTPCPGCGGQTMNGQCPRCGGGPSPMATPMATPNVPGVTAAVPGLDASMLGGPPMPGPGLGGSTAFPGEGACPLCGSVTANGVCTNPQCQGSYADQGNGSHPHGPAPVLHSAAQDVDKNPLREYMADNVFPSDEHIVAAIQSYESE